MVSKINGARLTMRLGFVLSGKLNSTPNAQTLLLLFPSRSTAGFPNRVVKVV